MNLLQNALARVARKALRGQPLRREKPLVYSNSRVSPAPSPSRVRVPRVSKDRLRLGRSNGSNLRKMIFRSFFKPLNMPNLKIYDDESTPYDYERAEANLAAKLRKDNVGVLNTYLSEKLTFSKMLDLLVDMTPTYLKNGEAVKNTEELARVLKKENSEYLSDQYPNVPRYSFSEIPPIPEPLTKKSFQEYIYTLTRCNFPYRNSSSLTSGLIPEILLYTHHLENEKFKPFRSVETFNYLIAFFGYNKFQNFFARGLLLVMAKDGHTPNIHTVNELLKICRIHNKRRSLVSTYQVVTNYLNLAARLDIPINLTTWNRVYDCIDNIFFKEALINKMMVLKLPILENMCIRILTDYSSTCQSTDELISFVENDLKRPQWREDPRLGERVLQHAISRAANDDELQKIIDGLYQEVIVDGLTLYQASWALQNNKLIFSPTFHLFCMYLALKSEKIPENYIALIKGLCNERNTLNIEMTGFILRGVIHDASTHLKLPLETKEPPTKELDTNNYFPFPIPRMGSNERYRILKRLTQNDLLGLEVAIIYYNHTTKKSIPMPWQGLTEMEILEWEKLKQHLNECSDKHKNARVIAGEIGLLPASPPTPDEIVYKYQRHNHYVMGSSTDSRLLNRLENGFDEGFQKEIRIRGISKKCI